MEETHLADKYAKALISVAQGAGLIDRVDKELAILEATLEKQPKLRQILVSPLIAAEEKRGFFEDIFKEKEISPELASFLFLLLKARRFNLFAEICRIYKDLIYSLRKRLKVFAESAFVLDEEQKKALKVRLAKIYQRNIDLFVRVNPALIGGAKLYVGHTLYDGTVKTRLSFLKNQLTLIK